MGSPSTKGMHTYIYMYRSSLGLLDLWKLPYGDRIGVHSADSAIYRYGTDSARAMLTGLHAQ